jgi:uncharacterized membrane protein
LKDKARSFLLEYGQLHVAEIYLIIALLIFGVIACFLLPVNGGYDEEEHLIRVWEMADYTFLPNEKLGNKLPFPLVFRDMSYRREFIVRAVPADFWKKYGSLSLDSMDYVYDVNTRSVYSPPLLLPQALVMRFLGRRQQLPALTVFYACRLAGLLSYILLSLLAVRLIPFGKWTLAILASSPVAILQAATVTPDAISNGFALLFIGGTLVVIDRKELHWRELTSLMILVLVLFLGKINIVSLALLPFLIAPISQFKVKHGYFIFMAAAIVLFLIEVAGWNLFAYSRYSDALSGADPSGQVKFILAHPIQIIGIITGNILGSYPDYLRAWIAIYGLDYWPVPLWTYYLYGASLLTTLLIKENKTTPTRRLRSGLAITFLAAYIWTIVSLYLSYTPVGSEIVRGVQGRYFFGVMPLLFLALSCLPFLKQIRFLTFLPFVLGGLSLVLYITGMYLSYHVTCGSQYYVGGLCYQPNYKNWAPNEIYSAPVSADLSIKQEVVAECNGMTEFRVWMDASTSDPEEFTDFSLVDKNTDREVVSTSILNANLPRKSWYILTFPPEMESSGKMYLLYIHAGMEKGQGPRIAYSIQQEYIDGSLYENGFDVNRDVIFQMGCLASWGK